MKDDDEYIKEMQMLTEQRKAENEKAWNELAIERQRTRTEKAKKGVAKTYARLISAVVIMLFVSAVATWIISLFLPNAIGNALRAFR